MTVVVDASALLCVLLEERGIDAVLPVLRGSMMSAVNLSETLAKLVDRGGDVDAAQREVERFEINMVAFDTELAAVAAKLRPATRKLHFSFADRACLALASARRLPVITADKDWAQLDLGIDIRLIR